MPQDALHFSEYETNLCGDQTLNNAHFYEVFPDRFLQINIQRPLTMIFPRIPQANKSFFGATLPAQKHALSATRQRHTAVTRAAKDYTVSPLLIAITHWSQGLSFTASYQYLRMPLECFWPGQESGCSSVHIGI